MYANQSTFAQIESIDFNGPLVPRAWLYHLRTGKKQMEHCYHEAVLILAEIVYWHRPSAEGKKRYAGRKLQLSYSTLADRLGMTKHAVKLATDYLEVKGLIRKDFQHPMVAGKKFGNVLFIDLNLERLEEISRLPEA